MKKSIVLIGLVIALICVFLACQKIEPTNNTQLGVKVEYIEAKIPIMKLVCIIPGGKEIYYYENFGDRIYIVRNPGSPETAMFVVH